MTPNILTQWTPAQFKSAEKIIAKYLNSRYWETHHTPDATPFVGCKTFKDYSNILGMSYTSTSIYAAYWICNTELFLDAAQTWKIEGFAIGSGGFVYAICLDKDENEILIPVN